MPDGGIPLAPARWVKQPVFEACTGYSLKAQRHKMDDGTWAEGKVWKMAPDGNRLMSLEGYYAWVEGR